MGLLQAFDLTGKVAAITGGASGIGKATAEVLAEAGAAVVVGDLDAAGAEKTAAGILEAGGRAVAHDVNVARKDEVESLVDRAVAEYGRLDVMGNVAGIAVDGKFVEATEEDLDKLIAVNLKGVFFGCQAALRVMIPQGSGSIINVASTAIDTPAPRYAIYGMTKAAVAQLTKTVAFEVGKHGVRVNTVAPGMTVSGLTARHVYEPDGSINQERYDTFVEQMSRLSPLRTVGDPIDQAYLILYLASDAARWCTGQTWRVNGGQAMA
ncbi:MAG TPA: glucose 1-dehydrogenase [Actinomycetota bacterium]|jgi:3-oxoacyl-[acyl-carrier protein] reductase